MNGPAPERPRSALIAEQELLRQMAEVENRLRRVALDPGTMDEAEAGMFSETCVEALDRLARTLSAVRRRSALPEHGHDGRPPVYRDPKGRTQGELKAGNVPVMNTRVDLLEELANTDEDSFGTGDTLHRLHKRKDQKGAALIDEMQLRAGRRLQNDFRLSILSPIPPAVIVMVNGGGSGTAPADAKCDAMDRYNKAMAEVGVAAASILESIVIDERTLEEVAASQGWHKRAMIPVLRQALDTLIAFYRRRDELENSGTPATYTRDERPLHPYHGGGT